MNNGKLAVGLQASTESPGSWPVQDRILEEGKEGAAGGGDTARLLLGTDRVIVTLPVWGLFVLGGALT